MKDTVLLVDDDQNLLEGLRRALRKSPYEILIANSGAEALTLLAANPVDVIVSDEKMPEMSGTEFLTQVRRFFPDSVRIMLTGEATIEAAVRAINEGEIFRFLRKPCNHSEVLVAIAQGLQHKKLMTQARRLLRSAKRQTAVLRKLHQKNPAFIEVERDATGAIVIDDEAPKDFDAFVAELNAEVEKADQLVDARKRLPPLL